VSVTLDHLLSKWDRFLDDSTVEEVCANGPDEVWVYQRGLFTRYEVPMSAEELEDIGILAAAEREQDVGNGKPLLRTAFVHRKGRLAVVLPPCVDEGSPSLTIRRESNDWPTLAELGASGLFKNTKPKRKEHTKTDQRLIELYKAGRYGRVPWTSRTGRQDDRQLRRHRQRQNPSGEGADGLGPHLDAVHHHPRLC
jgi:type IV secretion system protein VirB11